MNKPINVTVQIPEEIDRFYRKIAETRMISKAAILRQVIVQAVRKAAEEDLEVKSAFESVLSTSPKRK